MLDLNDFQPIEDSSNQNTNQQTQSENKILDMGQMNDMFGYLNNDNQLNSINPSIDEEEQKRILARQKEAEERKAKINKKILEEEEKRNEIRKKAAEYLVEFEQKRQEEISKKRKILEENEINGNNNKNEGDGNAWNKVKDNIDLKDSEYKGSKDVGRMREAMMNRQKEPNSEPLQNFFG